jgi:hypothetical protein
MESVPVTANLTMLRINGWRAYVWQDGECLAELNVETACFGHGDPIASGAGAQLGEAAAALTSR